MSLGAEQREFTKQMAEWTLWVYEQGYELSDGDAFRDERVHGKWGEKKSYSHPESNHKRRLARDYNLFKDGKFLGTTEAHRELGENWESRHPHNRWGGRWNDGNHYERVPGGWR